MTLLTHSQHSKKQQATNIISISIKVEQPWSNLTIVTFSINHHGPVPQSCKQEASGVLQAEHRAALWVMEGQ